MRSWRQLDAPTASSAAAAAAATAAEQQHLQQLNESAGTAKKKKLTAEACDAKGTSIVRTYQNSVQVTLNPMLDTAAALLD